MIDYHTHHRRCGHAAGELEEYVQQAIQAGLTEIGLSDHQPVLHLKPPELLPEVAMSRSELPEYVAEVLKLKEKYRSQIRIRLGLEADYVAGWIDETRAMLNEYPFDYVIGSVHFLGTWDITDARQLEGWKEREVWAVYAEYFEAVQQAAHAGIFDILGHIDVVKRFGFQPDREWTLLADQTVQIIAAAGVAVEVNTSGLRHKAAEVYPAPDTVRKLAAAHVPFTIGSDAHRPEDVARDYAAAAAVLQAAGVAHLTGFERRQPYVALRF